MENEGVDQQIADLERQLQERRAALEQGNDSEVLPSNKEVLHEMVGEKIQEHAPEYIPKQATPTPPQVQDDGTSSYLTQDLKDQIQELIDIVFTKSLDEGIKMAAKSNNPALIDAFHDVLVDELYNTLLERQKVKEVK